MTRSLAALLLVTACTTGAAPFGPSSPRAGTSSATPSATGTRLVVVLVIDQFPEWAFETKRAALTGGFARLLSEGEWRVGEHPSLATVTGPGHAVIGTGEPPARSGIVANEWWSRNEQRVVKAMLGSDGQPTTDMLRVPGLGDAVRSAGTGAKAVGVALKVRAARLMLGHRGLALFYDGKAGAWQSHGEPPPAWLARHAAEHPVALAPWTPLDATRLATLSGTVDAQPGEVGEKGFGATFPHDPAKTRIPSDAIFAMPLGNDVVLHMATAAIEGENLGTDASPDLLAISLSAHDYIAHGWGHESWEAWDAALRLDARLADFMAMLDERVGRDRWAMIVTSDHGGAPNPSRVGGGRYTQEQILAAANNAASLNLGAGTWIASASFPYIHFTPAAVAKDREFPLAFKKVVSALRSFPGLAFVDRTASFAGDCERRTGDAKRVCLAIDPARAGDIIYSPAAGWIIEEVDERLATAHGSLNAYDREVPVLVLPPGRTARAQPLTAPSGTLDMREIAPLLAGWLGVRAPTTLPR